MTRRGEGNLEIWEVEFRVPAFAIPIFTDALDGFGDSMSWRLEDPAQDENDLIIPWLISVQSRTPPDRAALTAALNVAAVSLELAVPEPSIKQLPMLDWVAETMRGFPPVRTGRFYVYGSHSKEPVPSASIPLMIDAGTAFGSGEHATTRGCLTALERLLRRYKFQSVLDVGCGTGILAMAAAKTTNASILAADIDPVAMRVTAFNAKRNGLGSRMRALTANGVRHREIRRRQPYDLILANILARPLVRLAQPISAHLAPGGIVILSGLLNRQEAMVTSAYRNQGLRILFRVRREGWSALALHRALQCASRPNPQPPL